jgi:hypothetical protein
MDIARATDCTRGRATDDMSDVCICRKASVLVDGLSAHMVLISGWVAAIVVGKLKVSLFRKELIIL